MCSLARPLLLGAVSSYLAALVLNPFHVIRQKLPNHRMTLGQYLDAILEISEKNNLFEGVNKLLTYQIVVNGLRLGLYDYMNSLVTVTFPRIQLINSIVSSCLLGFSGG